MLRCTTPTNIIKINLAPSVIKSLTVLYAQNKCVILEKEIDKDHIFPSEKNQHACFARVDLTQGDTAAFANVSAGKVEVQLVVQTYDNSVLYSHTMQAQVSGVLGDKMFDDAIAGNGQLDIDYDEEMPIVEGDFAPLTAVFDGEFDEVHYVSHAFEGLKTDDAEVVVDNDNWTLAVNLTEEFHQKNVTGLNFKLDPVTYELTIELLNKDGGVVATETKDLPIEKALIGISWDKETRSIMFKKESGDTVPVELTDIAMVSDVTDMQTILAQALETAIEQEQQAREKAVEGVQSALDQEVADRESAVTSERERAKKAEQANADAITEEAERAKLAEQSLSGEISAETARAKGEEQTLGEQISAETTRAQGEESAIRDELKQATDTSGENLKALEQSLTKQISDESDRATNRENEISGELQMETNRATTAESGLQNQLTAEKQRATTAEGKNAAAITAETERAQGVESELGAEIDAIQELIPTQATADNQLADKNFVNSTVSTQTATFRGNFATKAALNAWQYENSTTATNNDYAVVLDDETHNHECWRYKYSQPDAGFEGVWKEEYKVNNAPLTAAQVAALNSGVTTEKLAAMDKATADEVTRAKAAEQNNADAIGAEESRATAAEQANAKSIADEITRAKAAEQANTKAVSDEVTRAKAAEAANAKAVTDEQTRAKTAESELSDAIEAAQVTVQAAIEAEETRAKGAEKTIEGKIDTEIADRKVAITAEEKARDAAIKVETDRAKAEEAKKVNSAGGELKDTVVTFSDTEVTTDANVASGEKSSVLWAKVKRWFGRLKALAFKATVGSADIDAKAVTTAKLDDTVNSALNAANSAVQPNDLAPIATSGNLADGNEDETHRLVTDEEKKRWDAAAGGIGVPTKTSDLTNDGEDGTSKFATQQWVQDQNYSEIPDGSITETKLDVELQGAIAQARSSATKTDVEELRTDVTKELEQAAEQILPMIEQKVDKIDLATVATTGSYNDLSDTPEIPTVPGSLPPTGAAGGDLTEEYPNPTIKSGAVSNTKIADGAISKTKLDDDLQSAIDKANSALQTVPNVSVTSSGSGNAVTGIAQNGHGITVTKSETFAKNADLTALTTRVSTVEGKIPTQTSATNQLADKAFVNSTVQTNTANFRGNWVTWTAVPTVVNDYPADYAGSRTPTVNDYLVVQNASDYSGQILAGTWRFKYSGVWGTNGKNGWKPEYQVNETPLTAAQLAALNSGITADLVTQIGTNKTDITAIKTKNSSQDTAITKAQSTADTANSSIAEETTRAQAAEKKNADAITALQTRATNIESKNTTQDTAISTAQTAANNAVKFTTQSLTDAQKTQARSNLGLATVATSGSYADLTNKPTIPTIPNITVVDNGSGTFVTDVTASGHTVTLTRGNASSYTLPKATTSALGGVKAAGTRTSAITPTQGGTTSGRYYGVEVDSNGKAFVNVPWENTHQSLSNYYTKTQTDSAISTAIDNAIIKVLNTPV